ncbi:MAG: SAF domain-containing protein [Kineosporiaceae bacterium]
MSLQHPAPTVPPSGSPANGSPLSGPPPTGAPLPGPDTASSGWQPRGPDPRLVAPGPVPPGPQAGGGAGSSGDRLPRPPRRRSAGLAALAVLLVAGSAALAGLLALRIDERVDVLVARTDIPAGTQITESMLAVAPVAAQGVNLVPASRRSLVVGRYAAVPIPAERLIDTNMVTDRSALRGGTVAIGVVLAPGTAPAGGLEPGDRVTVYGTDAEGEVLTREAVVSSVKVPESGSFGSTGSDTVATLIVPEGVAAAVTAANAAGKLALGLTERGASIAAGADG